MGMRGAAALQAALLQGLRADTPVAIVHQVSLPTQRHAVCALAELHDTVVREKLTSPSVIVVGDVFKGLLDMQQHAAANLPQAAQG
jgi:uroporphyrin-III C-methyltransferase